MFQILVVEDDRELRDLFCTVLTENGYTSIPASNGMNAFDILDHTYVDLIISDVMMPVMDGFEMIRAIREANYTMPILIITAKEDPAVWRVEALLRRSQIVSQRKTRLGSTEFDFDSLTVRTPSSITELPQKEFLLLFKLAASPSRIFTRRQIMEEIWGIDSETDTHTLDVHISRLREKFKSNPDFDIVTVRGLGYKAVKKQHE